MFSEGSGYLSDTAKKWSFPLRVSLGNVISSAGNYKLRIDSIHKFYFAMIAWLREISISSVKAMVIIFGKPEAALPRCFYQKLFWKYVTNLQKNTHAKVRFRRLFEITLRCGCFPVNLLDIHTLKNEKNSGRG